MEYDTLNGDLVTLVPADARNVGLLVQWTLDPVAQGSFKTVPDMTLREVEDLLLRDPDRRYFLIQRTSDETPLGRFYFRRWLFNEDEALVDWELNIFLAAPTERARDTAPRCSGWRGNTSRPRLRHTACSL